jgi:hypothetical protein
MVECPTSKVFRDRADECRTMAETFNGEKRRAVLLKIAADYERMADQAAMFELEQADRAAQHESRHA